MISVFCSINLDFTGTVPRLPGPGETVAGSGLVVAPGGKGANQALAARRAGADVQMIGSVGDDAMAAEALALLADGGVGLDALNRVGGSTGTALIVVDAKGENQIAVLPGANARADAGLAQGGWTIGAGDILLAQQEVPQPGTIAALNRARAAGAVTIWNSAPILIDSADVLPLCDFVIANETEFALLFGGKGAFADRLTAAGAKGQTVVVTLGAKGAIACHEGQIVRQAAPEIAPVDTVGAGDTFCGYLAAGIGAGLPFALALERAVFAGALACLKPGAQPAIPYADAVAAAVSKGAI